MVSCRRGLSGLSHFWHSTTARSKAKGLSHRSKAKGVSHRSKPPCITYKKHRVQQDRVLSAEGTEAAEPGSTPQDSHGLVCSVALLFFLSGL